MEMLQQTIRDIVPKLGIKWMAPQIPARGLTWLDGTLDKKAGLAPPIWDGTTNSHRLNPPKLMKLPTLFA